MTKQVENVLVELVGQVVDVWEEANTAVQERRLDVQQAKYKARAEVRAIHTKALNACNYHDNALTRIAEALYDITRKGQKEYIRAIKLAARQNKLNCVLEQLVYMA